MNNDQNNIVGGVNPIPQSENQTTPVLSTSSTIQTPLNEVPSQPIGNDAIPGSNLQPQSIGIVSEPIATSSNSTETLAENKPQEFTASMGAIPIQPVPGATSQETSTSSVNNPITPTNEQVSNENILSINSNSIVPEMNKNIESQGSITPNSNNTIPELKLDSSSPFDIGIGANNESNPPLSNQTNLTPDLSAMNTMSTNTTTVQNPVNTSSSVVTSTSEKPLTNENPANITTNDEVVSVKKYLGTLILFSIPIVGFIMLLIKAFSNSENKNISNLAKAQLLYALIIILLYVVIVFLFGIILTNTMVAGVAGM